MRRRIARLAGAPLEVAHAPRVADAIVVLGTRLKPDGSLTQVGDERVRAGATLWHQGRAPVLALTGGRDPLGGAPIAEAVAFAARARELGVPESAMRIEPESSNTADNARFTAKILHAENRRTVWIVTQPFHLRRALFWFRRAGFDALGHRIENSLQDRDASLALKWIAQEYVSWTKLWTLEAVGYRPRR